MDLYLGGKVVVVTGGSRGIGRSICQIFSQEGAKLVINFFRHEQEAKKVVNIVEKSGSQAIAVKANIEERKAVEKMVQKSLDKFERIDVLVNNAGINISGSITTITEKEWDKVLRNHLNGTFNCTQVIIPYMIKQRYGKI
ncbi:unnamed protein product, partial [marine sediment metagenome]